jgi:hypothetical protein
MKHGRLSHRLADKLLASVWKLTKERYQESIFTLFTTFDASGDGFNSHSSNWLFFTYSFF